MHTCPTCGHITGIRPSPHEEALLRVFLAHEGEWIDYAPLLAVTWAQSINLLKVRIHSLNQQLRPQGYRIVNARYHHPKGPKLYKLEKWQS